MSKEIQVKIQNIRIAEAKQRAELLDASEHGAEEIAAERAKICECRRDIELCQGQIKEVKEIRKANKAQILANIAECRADMRILKEELRQERAEKAAAQANKSEDNEQ